MPTYNDFNLVFSTNPDLIPDHDNEQEEMTLPPEQQQLLVQIDRKQRKGKSVTLVTGFVGGDDDLKALGKMLKTKCGVGGSVKDNAIIIQGDFKQKIADLLKESNYKVKVR